MKKLFFFCLLVFAVDGAAGNIVAAEMPEAAVPPTSVPYLTPAEEAKTFVLPDGYRLELVVSDPVIKEPVAVVFDSNGRMFVAEMRAFMQNINGKDERMPVGRISVHWSSKGDGVYDKHAVFVDQLVLPRMIMPYGNGLLVNETDSQDIWFYHDTFSRGVADRKKLLYAGGARTGNVEHQQSGLIWDLDNWLYMAVNAYRLRFQGTNVIKETTPANNGQWGVSQDNYGKLWFVNGGGELGPVNFQQPIVYGAFTLKDQVTTNFLEVWPLVSLGDAQGGPKRLRPEDNTLNHITAACGGEIYRGDRLPADLRGDLLFAEPVGRLIRRSKVEVREGVTYLRNAYDHSEFIRSTDPNFRPVNIANGPDGTLYIVDMYRGIIQEGNWVKEGSYLRKVAQQYQLDKNIGRGRIWRLVHRDFEPGPPPKMRHERSAKLVTHLEHPNGWWRDTAQHLLVFRGDKSVAGPLVHMTLGSTNHLARIHALWTLEGIGALEPWLVREMLLDVHPQVRIAAIRASETLYKHGDKSLMPHVLALAKDPDPNVVIQVMLTANLLRWPDAPKLVRTSLATNPARGVREIGTQLLEPKDTFNKGFTFSEKKVLEQGEMIYRQICFACHAPDGRGMPVQGDKAGATLAPPLAGSPTALGLRDGIIDVILKGLSGPVHGKSYGAQMAPMEGNDDAWVAAVTSYVRNSFGNSAPLVDTNDVARVRAAVKDRADPWTLEELDAALPQALTNRPQWSVTASHRPQTAPLAIDGNPRTRFTTGASQAPGMWFQIELPEETTITGLQLDAGTSPRDFPRGYVVELSGDGKSWGNVVAVGQGDAAFTEILFPATKTKFIRITQTDFMPGIFWSIQELQILRPGEIGKAKPVVTKKAEPSGFE